MPRANRIVRLAWLIYAIAWVVPVHRNGDRLPEVLPGWQAFRVAMNPVWPYDGDSSSEFSYWGLLSVASALSNIVMVASVPIMLRGTSRQRVVLAWGAFAAVLLNAQWVIAKDWTNLRVGYYLWWASFLVVGVALLQATHALQPESVVGARSGPTKS